nr:putative zinc finger, CCHC-type [Tanacetum cinerariifolium]
MEKPLWIKRQGLVSGIQQGQIQVDFSFFHDPSCDLTFFMELVGVTGEEDVLRLRLVVVEVEFSFFRDSTCDLTFFMELVGVTEEEDVLRLRLVVVEGFDDEAITLGFVDFDSKVTNPMEGFISASNNIDLLHESKCFLSRNFDMKDLGEASYVIGIEIHRDRANGKLGLSQKAYIERVLNRFNMQHCSTTVAPVIKGDVLGRINVRKLRLNMRK